jgi:hypothetical protein
MIDQIINRIFEAAQPFNNLKPGEGWVAVTNEQIEGLQVRSAMVGEGRNRLIDRVREEDLRGRDVEVMGIRGGQFIINWPKKTLF